MEERRELGEEHSGARKTRKERKTTEHTRKQTGQEKRKAISVQFGV
jgi:hypothetical protein